MLLCYLLSLCPYVAIFPSDENESQESEAIHIMTGNDLSFAEGKPSIVLAILNLQLLNDF